ncbi:MAG TPA: MFS transporter [Pyrinomonadaceae bacterium]|nr:MFS transporter [Pyrinomonadaceae bacterium]
MNARIENRRALSLGLTENIGQFSLLVLINAFVGGMVGLERTVLPLIAERDFGIASRSAILSFIISFGVVKAFSNLIAGRYSDRIGRKKLLVFGWLFGIPVPFLIIWAPSWTVITFANVLLGINQGLCWSTTVIMKIDLVGPKRRGFAMGLNEFAGYGAVALAALASGYLASIYGLRPVPFYLGIVFAVLGLFLSLTLVRDTTAHASEEARLHHEPQTQPTFKEVFSETSYRNPTLFSVSQAGLVNNLNDGMAWGLFPLFFAAHGLGVESIAVLVATYPAVWSMLQVATGALSDRCGRKSMIVIGMWMQAAGILLVAATPALATSRAGSFFLWIIGSVLLGIGTALVYPTLLAAIGDVVHPAWRASAVGVYRLWRDLGYAVGALLSGVVADLFGLTWAIVVVAILTFVSGVLAALRMKETKRAN